MDSMTMTLRAGRSGIASGGKTGTAGNSDGLPDHNGLNESRYNGLHGQPSEREQIRNGLIGHNLIIRNSSVSITG